MVKTSENIDDTTILITKKWTFQSTLFADA